MEKTISNDDTGRLTQAEAMLKFSPLVRKLASKNAGHAAEYQDLLQIGYLRIGQLVGKAADQTYLAAYLKRALEWDIYHAAKQIRQLAACECTSEPVLENALLDPVGHDWHERETAMFRKLEDLLTEKEMKLALLLYGGNTRRHAAKLLGVSHTAVQKRLTKIQEKLLPIKMWLEDMREFPCTNIPLFDCMLTATPLPYTDTDEDGTLPEEKSEDRKAEGTENETD